MYGMIHRAIYDFLAEQNEEIEEEELQAVLQISRDEMISTHVYPDTHTLELVANAAGFMGMSSDEFMCQLGRFWLNFAERSAYRHILDFTGNDLVSFIENLDRMHRSVVLAMPHARVPSFSLVESDADGLVIDYRSSRTGLEPFVLGLMQGLLDHFEQAGTVDCIGTAGCASRFVIRYCD